MFHEHKILPKLEKPEKSNTSNFFNLSPIYLSIKYVTEGELNEGFWINIEFEVVYMDDAQVEGVK